jgi:tyrosyl-tRNA synthetase
MKQERAKLVALLRLSGSASSNSEARRLIQQGGVSLGPDADSLQTVNDIEAELKVEDGTILKVGKRRFFRLRTK